MYSTCTLKLCAYTHVHEQIENHNFLGCKWLSGLDVKKCTRRILANTRPHHLYWGVCTYICTFVCTHYIYCTHIAFTMCIHTCTYMYVWIHVHNSIRKHTVDNGCAGHVWLSHASWDMCTCTHVFVGVVKQHITIMYLLVTDLYQLSKPSCVQYLITGLPHAPVVITVQVCLRMHVYVHIYKF